MIRIKDAIQDFVIFVPSNSISSDDEICEANAIAVLTGSCSKNQCHLEFELTLRQLEGQKNEQDKNEEDDENSFAKYKFVIMKIRLIYLNNQLFYF